MNKKKKITLQDIATAAGVGKSTASYALNKRYPAGVSISDEKRKHIQMIAKQMKYEIDDMAGGIKTGRTKVIAHFHSRLDVNIWYGISSAAQERSYLIKTFSVQDIDKHKARHLRDICIRQRICGAIFHFPKKQASILHDLLKDEGIVTASTAECDFSPDVKVISDNMQGGEIVGKHFKTLKCKKIALVGSDDLMSYQRFKGFKKVFDVPDENIIFSYDHIIGRAKVLDMLQSKKPEAIFCASDGMAIMVYCLAAKCNMDIPKDIKVVGYGNRGEGRYSMVPALTSVSERSFELGHRCCSLLINAIEKKITKKIDELYPVELIVRESC